MIWPFGRASFFTRLLRRQDSEACAKLHKTGFAHPWSSAEFEALFDPTSVTGEAAVLPGGGMVGFVLSRRAGGEAEILTVVVAPNRRRDGVGLELMKAHLGRLASLGAGSVFLEVDENNSAARALYSRLGFEKVGARSAYYRHGEGPQSAALILRCLL